MYKLLKKLVKKYLIQLIIIFLLANSTIALLIFTKAQSSSCMTQAQIDSDSRCLYVYQSWVYEKGTRDKPHKGHQCGMNVDSIIPNLHLVGSVLTKFNNDKVAPFCTTVDPTQTPTTAPTEQSATQTLTVAPTQQPGATEPSKTNTPTPTSQSVSPASVPTIATTGTASPTYESYTGNSFGEILGKPRLPRIEKAVKKEKEFSLTTITKPVSYVSIATIIGSIILILLF